jgi:uncharacterized LabA/DUF88 family protein
VPPIVYAFIDSQNVNLGVQSQGWKLDWQRFRQYLRDKYQVWEAYLFIGKVDGMEDLYAFLRNVGSKVILKPTMTLPNGKVKGNVDAELVLHAMIEYFNYDKAIVASGDGDFYCLVDYLAKAGKLLRVIVPNQEYSHLLSTHSSFIVPIDQLRGSLEYKKQKTGMGGRSKP